MLSAIKNFLLNLNRKQKKKIWGIMFFLPFFIIFLVFTIYPVLMSHIYAFYEWPGFGPLENFVGLNNFRDVLSDSLFWDALKRSAQFMLGSVAIQIPFALFIAILLNNNKLKGRYIYRTLIFIPVVMTSAVVGVIMRSVFAAHNGLVNIFLQFLNIIDRPINWLGSGKTALFTGVLVASWRLMGIKMVYWLAGLQSVPAELYEAAEIDGASKFQLFRYVTLPLLIPIGIVILLISVIDSLKVFDLIYTLTGGGPGHSTEVIEVFIYRYAFTSGQGGGMAEMGYASSAAVIFGVLAILISLLANFIMNKVKK
jgi:multiple sugar transport system permease protein